MSAPMRKHCRSFLRCVRASDTSMKGYHQSSALRTRTATCLLYFNGTVCGSTCVLDRKFEKSTRLSLKTLKGDNSILCIFSRANSCSRQRFNNSAWDDANVKNKARHIQLTFNTAYSNSADTPNHVEPSTEDKSHYLQNNCRKPENIYTIPNLLTLSRIVATPVIGYLVVQESYSLALGLFTLAGFTDLLDGYIARNFKNQMSAFGTALDPLADKILITVLTVTLTCADLLPYSLAGLIISRDVLLVLTGFIIRYTSLPPPITLKRYFDATNPTAKLLPSTLSKFNTCLQLVLVCSTLAAPVFDFVNHPALQCLWVATAATTLGSGVDYVINRKAYVQYLNTAVKSKP